MRTKYIIIAILGIICNHPLSAQSIHIPQNEAVIANFSLNEETPFDAFSPETSRIILNGDSIADLRNEQLLLVDIATHRPIAAAPFTDEIKNWLSVE